MTTYDSTATTVVADDATATLSGEVVARLTLTRRLAATWTVVGLTLFVVGVLGFARLYATVVGESALAFDGTTVVLLFVGGGLAILVPHELCHGLAMRAYGARPRYGVGVAFGFFPYAYATSDATFSRRAFLVIVLAPLVVISALGAVLMLALDWPWLVIPLALNVGGAVGDLWMALFVLGFPASVRVRDDEHGLTVLGSETETPTSASRTARRLFADAGVASAVAFAGLVVAAAFSPLIALVLGWDALSVTIPVVGWPVFAVELSEMGFAVQPDGFGIALSGLLVGCVVALLAAVGRRLSS